ncbi:MAG: 4-oxalocrotonate tautomerase family protein [Cryobacterium sp.]|nr:4-oxalocrotonate tautomerase family protein [Cryobacterium sp.]
MPLVEITMTEGRSAEQLRSLLAEVHDAVERALSVPQQSIRVLVREIPETHWQSGRVTIAEKKVAEA